MNDFAKTGVFLGGAAVLVVLASVSGPGAVSNELFSDEGELFFAEFTDPTAATELEVWQFDTEASELRPFNVRKDERGVWTIPSHSNYPADATDRMAQAAAMLVGLRKESVRTDLKSEHKDFGVVNPRDEGLETEGRGTLVTFKDKSGAPLAELIIGDELEGKVDTWYVRVPGKKRVYTAKFENELSTRFADWIETDLLKAKAWDMQKLVFDNYSVDETQGAVVAGDRIEVTKDDGSQWQVVGVEEGRETDQTKVGDVARTLGEIKIVGVRRKPDGLTARLQQAQGFDRMALMQHLQDKGYFLARDGRLVSNEGDLIFHTNKGVIYTLKFGEIAYGDVDAVSSGAEPDAPPPGQEGPQPMPANNRFLMVTAEFDEGLLDKPAGERLDAEELEKRKQARQAIEAITAAVDRYREAHEQALPGSLAELTQPAAEGEEPLLAELEQDPWQHDYVLQQTGDTFVVLSYGKDGQEGGLGLDTDIRSDQWQVEDDFAATQREWEAYDTKVEEGQKKAEELSKRFGPWYYVISEELFQKLKPSREDLTKAKEPEAGEDEAGAPTSDK